MNMITPAAARRCARQTLAEQLAALRLEQPVPEPTGPDTTWSGHHPRLANAKGWDHPEPPPPPSRAPPKAPP